MHNKTDETNSYLQKKCISFNCAQLCISSNDKAAICILPKKFCKERFAILVVVGKITFECKIANTKNYTHMCNAWMIKVQNKALLKQSRQPTGMARYFPRRTTRWRENCHWDFPRCEKCFLDSAHEPAHNLSSKSRLQLELHWEGTFLSIISEFSAEAKVLSVIFSWWEKLHWRLFCGISLGINGEITWITFCNFSNQP